MRQHEIIARSLELSALDTRDLAVLESRAGGADRVTRTAARRVRRLRGYWKTGETPHEINRDCSCDRCDAWYRTHGDEEAV